MDTILHLHLCPSPHIFTFYIQLLLLTSTSHLHLIPLPPFSTSYFHILPQHLTSESYASQRKFDDSIEHFTDAIEKPNFFLL